MMKGHFFRYIRDLYRKRILNLGWTDEEGIKEIRKDY